MFRFMFRASLEEAPFDGTAITRALDGALLIFQRFEGHWMIDRVSAPANDCDDEDLERDDEPWCFEGSTAVARDEVVGLCEFDRRRYHARQLRRLGLPARGHASRALWRMISDWESFAP